MDAVLRQSKSMCPFLKKTSPATLRSLSTTAARHASPGGGSMSNLQTIARRCPIMGQALAVQTAKSGKVGLGGVAALGAIRAFTNKASTGKARLHTSRSEKARAIEDTLFGRDRGTFSSRKTFYPTNRISAISSTCQTCPSTYPAHDSPPQECRQVRLRGVLQCRVGQEA